MRTYSTALLGALALGAVPLAARAEGLSTARPCSGEVALGVSEGYILPYHGFDVADGKLVAEADATYGCDLTRHDRWNVEVGATHPLAHLDYNLGKEAWITGSLAHRMKVPYGDLTFSGSVSYRDESRLDDFLDDSVRLTGRMQYRVAVGRIRLLPYAEIVRDVPVKENNILNWKCWGVPASLPLAGGNLHGVFTDCRNENSTTAVIHKNDWYGSLGYELPPWRGFRLDLGANFTEYNEKDSRFKWIVNPNADGRIEPVPRAGDRRRSPFVGAYMSVSRAF